MFDMTIFPEAVRKTTRLLGVNIEIQEHHEASNLWDWLADSGAAIAREFHPEQSLRTGEVCMDAWEAVASRADLENFRENVRSNPEGDLIQWQAYTFDTPVRWIGVPDGIVNSLNAVGVQALVSMGYGTKLFPRPLVTDPEFDGVPDDAMIDWPAAASAYDYYFAMIYHFASKFGSRYFLMHNEPECCMYAWHMPPDIEASDEDLFSTPEKKQRCMRCLSTQWGVLAQIARMAVDDVRALLGNDSGEFFLAGPVNGTWEPFWEKCGDSMDSLDYHHYHPDPVAFETIHAGTAAHAAQRGKRLSVSEFNVKPGPLPFREILFDHPSAIRHACMLMRAMQLSRPDEPVYEFLALYLLSFPGSHRNYKSLVYGDTNVLDWAGHDLPLNRRPDEWYPTFEEMQLRFATPSYHIFRMLARCTPGMTGNPEGNPVLRTGVECLIDDALDGAEALLTSMVVDAGDCLIINLLNPSTTTLTVPLNLCHVREPFRCAVTRTTSASQQDEVAGIVELDIDRLEVESQAMSLMQIILTPLALDRVESLRLEEQSTTPGSLDQLELHQTTRLRALGTIDGQEVDLTELCISWTSSDPLCVPVYQAGLVQRMRRTSRDVSVSARVPGGPEVIAVVKGLA